MDVKIILGLLMVTSFTAVGQNTFPSSGNVGIGTTSPSAPLHVTSTGSTYIRIDKPNSSYENGLQFTTGSATKFYLWSDNADNDALKIEGVGLAGEDDSHPRMMFPSDNKNLYMALSGGNVGIGTTDPGLTTHILGALGFPANSGARQTGVLRLQGAGSNGVLDFSINAGSGASLQVTNQTDLSWKYPLILNPNGGNVGIGTTAPDAKLTVSGQIHAQEVKVTINAPGPDYVFEEDYKLTSLEEIKNYIDRNKHLPEVPSAKEMEKNGVQLGEMNMLLLKKIEELTLYMIELKTENGELKKQSNRQQDQINYLSGKFLNKN